MKYFLRSLGNELEIFKVRFLSVRRPIRLLAIWAICSIFLAELVLYKTSAFTEWQYRFGQIHLKLCYSYISAFVFYLLAVHWPKETRKVKTSRLINNKVMRISDHIGVLIDTILGKQMTGSDRKVIPLEEYKANALKINPHRSIESKGRGMIRFSNYFELISHIKKQVREESYDIMILGESVDSAVIESLTNINDAFTNFFDFEFLRIGNTDLVFLCDRLYNLNKESEILVEAMRKAYKKYWVESNINYYKRGYV